MLDNLVGRIAARPVWAKTLLLLTALVVLLLAAWPAWAALPKAASLPKAAYWRMNERSGKMIDSSANNNNGTPSRSVVQTGSTYRFNGKTSHVVVPDSGSLDPGAKNIKLTARLKVDGGSLDDDSYDVVRKGISTTPGGDYKMEIRSTGKLNCVFKGSGGKVHKQARPDVVDGKWHTLECKKTRDSVVARVDGGRSYTQRGSAGSISSSSNVMVGARKARPFDDMFDGSMHFVSIDIAR